MENVFIQFSSYINVFYLATFMLLGYIVKKYLQDVFCIVFNKQIKFVFIILILAALVSIPFLLAGETWQKVLLSYAVGTSLHEVVFTFLEKKIKKVLEEDEKYS